MSGTGSKINIQDIALKAKVSKSTVSRFLNGGYVSGALKRKLERIVSSAGYRPSPQAQNLSRGRAGCFGLLTHYIDNPWFSQILVGVEAECHRQRVSILVGSMGDEAALRPEIVEEWIRSKRVDGIILTNPGKNAEPIVRRIVDAGLKLTLLGADHPFPVGQVINSDNRDAGRKVGLHLLGLGHRRFAYVGGDREYQDSVERLEGLREVLRKAGLKGEPRDVVETEWRPEDGAVYAERWAHLGKKVRPTAVVCANDFLALGFMRRVVALGFRVPGEVSVTGMDDLAIAGLSNPSLTTVRQDMKGIGEACLRSLAEQVQQPAKKKWPQVLFPVVLVARESSANPAS